jgi:hypothetical protein
MTNLWGPDLYDLLTEFDEEEAEYQEFVEENGVVTDLEIEEDIYP